jgi:hypothetical protein
MLSSENFARDRLKIAIDTDIKVNSNIVLLTHQIGTPLCQHLILS